jgi:hypothetical protein
MLHHRRDLPAFGRGAAETREGPTDSARLAMQAGRARPPSIEALDEAAEVLEANPSFRESVIETLRLIPLVLVFQRKIVSGLTAGAVKD